jgi:hypothetical protein
MEKEIKELIQFWQSQFRILKNWDIEYKEDSETESECLIYPHLKKAYIHKYNMFVKGELCTIELYIKHEILHIAISMMKSDETGFLEETFVQDLCKLI